MPAEHRSIRTLDSAPSVVLIVGDHHRADVLGRAGCRLAHTPNLDRLSREGATFSRAVTVFPQDDVALRTMLAGVHAHRLTAAESAGFSQAPLCRALTGGGYRIEQVGEPDGTSLAEVVGQARAFLDRPPGDPFLMLVRLPAIGGFADIPDSCLSPHRRNGTPLAAYFGAITAYDDAAGQIVEATERQDGRGTVVIYTSLSGEHFKYRDSVSHANTCHNESIRVPLILSWPGHIASGRTLDALVGLHDITPTVAEIAGVDLPSCQGRSLLSLLKDDARPPDWRQRIYVENQHQRHIRASEDPQVAAFRLYLPWRQRAIWDGRYKLVLSADRGCGFLFDHATDPEEEFNLYDVPRPSPHRLYEHFRSRRNEVLRLAERLSIEARTLGDDLGVEMAAAAIADPEFGKLGPGEPLH